MANKRHRRFDPWAVLLALLLLFAVFCVAAWPHVPVSAQYRLITTVGRTDARCTLPQVQADAARDAARSAAINQHLAALPQPVLSDGLLRIDAPEGTIWAPQTAAPLFVAAVNPPRVRWDRIGPNGDTPIRQGDIMLDGGGHLGESTLRALELGAARVVTFEPDPENARALRRNLSQSIADERVIVIEKGMYDRVGSLTFVAGGDSASGEFQEGAGSGELPVTTIDQVVSDLQLPRVDFIKLDIEGSEVPALRGAVETLRRFKPRIVVGTYHHRGDLAGVEQAVRSARQDYAVTPARCLPYEGSVFPLLLFFH